MKDQLKKRLPGLYAYYQHIARVRIIHQTQKLKKLSHDQMIENLNEQYYKYIGHRLDWDHLETYTEKMQWEKVCNKDPRKTLLADKYAVRAWVAEKIGEEYLIPLLGCWDRFEDIDFSSLPDRYVLKTNHGTGTNVIVNGTSPVNRKTMKRMFDDWLRTDYGYCNGFELHYSDIRPRIIAEAYIEAPEGEDLSDYKFLCFGGKPYYCWVDKGRYTHHTRNVYDMDWNLQPWTQENFEPYREPLEKPENFDKMVELAAVLCQDFPQVRVDFYNISGKIYFGEMTFTNGRGYSRFIPEKYDKILGDLWQIQG